MGNDKRILVNHQGLSDGVSGSCYIVRITFTESKKELVYLVDCGMFLGDSTGQDGTSEKEESSIFNLNFPIDMSKIEGVFVTHGHIDHIGRLPFLTKYGYSNPIYISRGTDAFLYQALSDTQRVIEKKINFPDGARFSQKDVEKVISLRKVIDFEYEGDYRETKLYQRYKKRKEIGLEQKIPQIVYKSPNIRQVYFDGKNEVVAHFFSNGHLIGSACILLEINVYDYNEKIIDNVNILYTGDYKAENPFFKVPKIPKKYFKRPITIVTESTYGKSITSAETVIYQEHPEVAGNVNEETGDIFQENVIRCIAGGGSMLIPVIALERTETIMSKIRELQDNGIPIFFNPEEQQNKSLLNAVKTSKEREQGGNTNKGPVFFDEHKCTFKLSDSVPIFLIGNLATSYLNVFLNRDDIGLTKAKVEKIKPRNFATYGIGKDPMELLKLPGQKIILSTPGMMTGGNSLKLGLNMIQDGKNWIHFTSYVATGIAQELINAKRGRTLAFKNGMLIPIRGVVVQTTEFSGHARPNVLMSFINRFSNVKSVIVTHGSPSAKIKFAQYIKKQRPDIRNIVISNRKVNFRISNEGVDKVISTSSNFDDIHPERKEYSRRMSGIDYSKVYAEADKKKGEKKRIKKSKKYGYNRKGRRKKYKYIF